MTIADSPNGLPSLDTVLLPSRAVFRSWRSQTIPARLAALEESEELFAELSTDDDPGLRDMALLGLVADAMQPLEDLAHLATAADAPFQGIANYIRATTYSDRIPTNFWQGIDQWDEDRLDVLAGFAMRDPDTKTIIGVLNLAGFSANLDADTLLVLDKARTASHKRLRSSLSSLAADWEQFGPYFRAFKHGGLAVNRADAAFFDDGVANPSDQTPRSQPSLGYGAGAAAPPWATRFSLITTWRRRTLANMLPRAGDSHSGSSIDSWRVGWLLWSRLRSMTREP